MARTLFRLTDRVVNKLAAPGYHGDGGGLYLQISKSGTRSWIFRFSLRKRSRDMGLGSAQFVSLAEARAKASECRALVAKGIDPIEAARAERETQAAATQPKAASRSVEELTFREFAGQYIEARASTWSNAKHRDQWSTSLTIHAYPAIGEMPLSKIETPDILRVLEPMWHEKSETASRVRGRIERILAAASVRGLRPATNPAAWVGHLREALPPKKRSTPFAALSYREIPAFVTKLHEREGVAARALEFLVLTAARSGEVRLARWPEINFAERLWTVPAERMKARRLHTVPLGTVALELLDKLKPLRDLASGFVFPGLKHARPLSDMTLSKLLRSMGVDATVHGFRASFKTWAEQETETANVVIEAALAHIVGDKAERAYMRGDWLAKRRVLMADWAAFCETEPSPTVLSFPSMEIAS